MKSLLTSLFLTTFAFAAAAQESVALEKAQEGARKLNEILPQTGDFQITMNPDVEKPQAIKSGDVGLMVVPDQALGADTLKQAGEAVLPLAQLWTLNLVLAPNGHATDANQQRVVRLQTKDRELPVNLYFLGAARNAQGALELVVYGKDKEPLTRVPLSASSAGSQSFPIEISGEKQDDSTGRLTLNIAGQQTAALIFKKQE